MTASNLTPEERFRRRVSVDTESGCHVWIGATHCISGYGIFVSKSELGKWGSQHAHRAAWKMFVGAIPDGQNICHRCDNRRCVNVQHLFVGSDLDNMLDMARKGRGRKSFSGLPYGVSVRKKGNSILYAAQIGYLGKIHYGGCFRSIDDAHAAALKMKESFHGITGGNQAVVPDAPDNGS